MHLGSSQKPEQLAHRQNVTQVLVTSRLVTWFVHRFVSVCPSLLRFSQMASSAHASARTFLDTKQRPPVGVPASDDTLRSLCVLLSVQQHAFALAYAYLVCVSH